MIKDEIVFVVLVNLSWIFAALNMHNIKNTIFLLLELVFFMSYLTYLRFGRRIHAGDYI